MIAADFHCLPGAVYAWRLPERVGGSVSGPPVPESSNKLVSSAFGFLILADFGFGFGFLKASCAWFITASASSSFHFWSSSFFFFSF